MSALAKFSGEGLYGIEHGLREGTPLNHWPINFVFTNGGMGDFINYSASTKRIMETCPWVEGRIFAPRYINSLFKDIHPDWDVYPSEEFEKLIEPGTAFIAPGYRKNGVAQNKQLLTVLGAHLIDVGYAYFAGSAPAPADLTLPLLNYSRKTLHTEVKILGKYAVVPTGSSGATRRIFGRHINPILQYLVSKEITPVFLGKSDILGDGVTVSTFPDDIDYSLGLDLRNKTNIVQAATIMQHATMTLGLDCGLLHLAACMENSNVIFGYNITSIEHREPRRTWGETVNIAVQEKDLACAPCQSKLKHIGGHLFSDCFYKDNKCIDILFLNKFPEWIKAIDAFKDVE